MAEALVVSEQDIRRKIDLNGMTLSGSEDQIRAVLEKMGMDFGRSTFVFGDAPNRQWSNNRNAFYPAVTDTPPTPQPEATPAPTPAPAEPSPAAKEIASLKADLAEIKALKAQIAQEKALMNAETAKRNEPAAYAAATPTKKS
jgi:hypothetical protein